MTDQGPTTSYERALDHVRSLVTDGPPLDPAISITVHFHPNRLVAGTPLLSHLLIDDVYRSQFETGTSNGGLTARPGGDRWNWEHRIFGGAYDDEPPRSRPKYGSLNFRHYDSGGSIRFGSAHLRLATHVAERTTFCYPDSVFNPTAFGTSEHMPLIAAAEADRRDLLDDYIEAHVHGSLLLSEDVEEIVLDPSFQDSPVADAAARLPMRVRWHHGFRLHTDELVQHRDYRGPDVVAVGINLAHGGWLDPRIIEDTVTQDRYDPQLLKRLWHCVARFGHDWPRT